MIKLVVTNEKNLELYELEKVHVGENKFGYYLIYLPEMLNGFALSECNVELVQVLADNTSVSIIIDTTQQNRPIQKNITLDVTATAQTVTLSMLITHNGDIIGKTNQVTFEVHPTKNATPIDPREELDEIIAELRAENAELSETVETQAQAIETKDEQISGLNSQVTTLTTENQEQAATITRQNTTIDQLNSRVPALQQLDPINPSGIQQTYNPESPNIGFPQVIVNPVTAEGTGFRADYYKEGVPYLNKVGSYNPFPEHSYGGVYITAKDDDGYPTELLIINYDGNNTTFNFSFDETIFKAKVKKIIFRDCVNINKITLNLVVKPSADLFANFAVLEELQFEGISDFKLVNFYNCQQLKSVTFDNSVTTIGTNGWNSYPFLGKARSLKRLTLPTTISVLPYGFLSGVTGLEELIITNNITYISPAFMDGYPASNNLKTLHFPNSIETIQSENFLRAQAGLEFITIENGFNANGLNFSSSTLYSHETILSWFNALADRTGQTAYTLTIGTDNLNKMTAEEKAIATNKNWNLA